MIFPLLAKLAIVVVIAAKSRHGLEHFPKSVNRFLDKKCGKNK